MRTQSQSIRLGRSQQSRSSLKRNRRPQLDFALPLTKKMHFLSRLAELLSERYVGPTKPKFDL
ncbi:unnamed protein product [Hydatigera taeniaeformis]|uniref:Uncharacterized protein n=1 Tax=Hydatigena taeniaeformis TaxID=6205 RepID=A0A0R3X190_HYDTA|nr:unnamed protein product [Hydatigera taeniaeformis]